MPYDVNRLARAFVRGVAKGLAAQTALENVPPPVLRQRLFSIARTARGGLDGAAQIGDPARRAEHLRDALERIVGIAAGSEE